MPGERDAENLRVALMSYDDRELRIRKFYLEEQSTIIRCTCFQSGEPVLQALRQERCFDVLVLSSQLEDMDSLTFLEKLNRLPSHPPLLLQGDGWADDITAAHAKGAELNLDFAASYEAVPYHPGAVAYFADKGITVNGK